MALLGRDARHPARARAGARAGRAVPRRSGSTSPASVLILTPRTVIARLRRGHRRDHGRGLRAGPPRRARSPPVAAMRDDLRVQERALRPSRLVLGSDRAARRRRAGGRRPDRCPRARRGLDRRGRGDLGASPSPSSARSSVTRCCWRAVRSSAKLFGTTGRLAGENALRNPRRTGATASALMIGLAVVSAVGVLAASLSATNDALVDERVPQRLPGAVAELPGLPHRGRRRDGARSTGSALVSREQGSRWPLVDEATRASLLGVDAGRSARSTTSTWSPAATAIERRPGAPQRDDGRRPATSASATTSTAGLPRWARPSSSRSSASSRTPRSTGRASPSRSRSSRTPASSGPTRTLSINVEPTAPTRRRCRRDLEERRGGPADRGGAGQGGVRGADPVAGQPAAVHDLRPARAGGGHRGDRHRQHPRPQRHRAHPRGRAAPCGRPLAAAGCAG